MATITPPFQFADTRVQIGHSFLFAQEGMKIELQDRLDVAAMGVISLRGDVAGSGTDTLRITDIGNIGYSLPFTALASETDTVADSPIDLGFETVTVGTFGLGQSETYSEQLFSREPMVLLDQLKAFIPQSWSRTFRDQVALTGSGITLAVGSATTDLSVDDHLDLVTVYRIAVGNSMPMAFLDPTQIDQLLRSYRNEPGFQNAAEVFSGLLEARDGSSPDAQIYRNVGGLRIDMAVTDSIVESGGAFQGFAFPQGGIGWAVGSTIPITPANPDRAIKIPQFGLLIEEDTDGTSQTTRRYRATSWMGFALGSERVHTLRRFISQT